MTQKGGRRKKPEILTPDKSDGPAEAAPRGDDQAGPPPPIIDMQAGKGRALAAGLGAGLLSGALAGAAVFAALYHYMLAGDSKKTARLLEDVQARLVVLERQEERVAAALALIVESEARLSGLEEGMKAADGPHAATLSRLEAADEAAAGFAARLTELETAHAGLAARLRDQGAGQPTQRSLLRPALLSNLSQALQTGRPFSLELAAVRREFPEQVGQMSSALAPYAETGLPRRETINQEFLGLVPQLLAALRRTDAEGFWARLLADFSAVLRIRRLDDVEGTDARAVLLRMEGLLRTGAPGAYPKTLELLATLPEGVQTDLADWSKAVAAHVAADRLMTDLSAQISTLNLTETRP
ncbi:MAG: COG4223 family protein [Parvibaculales bacterium]